ncbi:MAG: NUDIX hydrolase [Pseudoflavonifractor sp.]|nr:NUDIX hydrolase [Pseudoflavonifractor sp.]MDY3019806.1 NUDIX hydrolase [Oscillospiraceae bacterium]
MKLTEETVDSRVLYRGKIITVRKDTARLEDGKTAGREVVEHPGGVCILPLESDGSVLTVRQFRYPFGRVVEELPAGKLDGPEDPRAAAERELSEEVGAKAGELIDLGELVMSPGFCTEVLHMYLARGLAYGEQHLDEDEFLTVERAPFSALVERVMAGEITDAKTVAVVLKTKEYLSREAGGTK